MDFITALTSTPLPTLLVIGGFLFLLLSLVTLKKPIVIDLPPGSRKTAGVIGGIVLVSGVILYVFPILSSPEAPVPATPTLAPLTSTPSLTPVVTQIPSPLPPTLPPTPLQVPHLEVQRLDLPFSSRDDLPPLLPVPPHLITAGKTNFVRGNDLYMWVFVCAQQPTKWCMIQELDILSSGEWESTSDIGDQTGDCGLFDLVFGIVNSEENSNLKLSMPSGISQYDLPDFEDVNVFKVIRGLDNNRQPLQPPCS